MVYTLPNFTNGSKGIEDIVSYETTQLVGLVPGLLFLIFLAIMGVGYFVQERRTGAGNLYMWAAISGLITTTGAFTLFLYDMANSGLVLINIEVVLICTIVTIVCAFAFLISERQ